jgi:putative heme iron utilization protein
MKKQRSIRNARTLLRQSELGVLSTHSRSNEGFPFGSVSTFMSTVNGDAIFYISDLAQHTKNLLANANMCLTVYSGADGDKASESDPNAGARLSLLGKAERIDESEFTYISERFFKLYPESRSYQGTHDFAFFKLTTERARFIGGFGDIHWISKDEWMLNTPEWLESEQNMITHMNEDHMDAMQLMCQHHFNISATKVDLLAINPDGFFMRADQAKPVYINFEELAHTGTEARQQLVKLTHAARSAVTSN